MPLTRSSPTASPDAGLATQPPDRPHTRFPIWLIPWLVGVLIIILDQVSKQAILHNAHGEPGTILRNMLPILRIEYVQNTGVAFSLFQQQSIVSLLVPIIIVIVIFAFSRYLPRNSVLTRIVEGMIVGGALSNLIDRIRHGFVVDFIGVHIGGYYWPFFNVADSAITVGIVTLALYLVIHGEMHHPPQ